MAGPSPHTTESTHPAEKAWRKTRRHGAPLQLHVFLVFYNDFSLSHSRNHAFCMVFYPCMLLLQCVLTRKIWRLSVPLVCRLPLCLGKTGQISKTTKNLISTKNHSNLISTKNHSKTIQILIKTNAPQKPIQIVNYIMKHILIHGHSEI